MRPDPTSLFVKKVSLVHLVTANPLLFYLLKLPFQLSLTLHLLLSTSHKHHLAVEFCAVHLLNSLQMRRPGQSAL